MRVLLFILLFMPAMLRAQVVDSLQKQLQSAFGSDRILLLNELCYQLMYENPNQAIDYGNEALQLALRQDDSLLLAQTYNDFSMPYLVTGNLDSVLVLNQLSYAIRMRNGAPGQAASNLSKMGQAYFEMGLYKESMLNQSKAYYILLAIRDSARLVQISNNLGVLFEKNKVYDLAKKWYVKSEELAMQLGDERGFYIARVNQAILARKMGDFNLAETLFKECKPYMESKGTYNELTKYYEAYGVLYRESGRNALGVEYYQKALRAYHLQGDEVGLANIYRNLANCYADLNQKSLALLNFEKALSFASKNDLFDQMQTIQYDLYSWHKQQDNTAKAMYFLEQHLLNKERVYNKETQDLILDYSARYNLAQHKNEALQKEKELLSTQVKLKTKTQLLQLSIAIVLLISLSLWWLYRSSMQKKLALQQENKLNMQEERIRISRDLHDNLGADLTWIASELDLMAYSAAPNQTRSKLDEMADKMRLAMRSLRETIWAIHQEESSLEQVIIRLKENAKSALEQAHIAFAFELPNNTYLLTPAQTLHLYRILKEALNNSIKHAQCEHVLLKVYESNKQLILSYTDDGIGLPQDDNFRKGYGLNNMKERALAAGFAYTLGSTKGFGLNLNIPIIIQMQNPV